ERGVNSHEPLPGRGIGLVSQPVQQAERGFQRRSRSNVLSGSRQPGLYVLSHGYARHAAHFSLAGMKSFMLLMSASGVSCIFSKSASHATLGIRTLRLTRSASNSIR